MVCLGNILHVTIASQSTTSLTGVMGLGCVYEGPRKVLQLGRSISNPRNYLRGGLLENTGGRDRAAMVDLQDVFLLRTAGPHGSGRDVEMSPSES
jgi:hypothetical protein